MDISKLDDGSIVLFATDFYEIFLYIFQFQESSRVDALLINHLFSRDFKFTLFSPAIFELRRHYGYLRRLIC